MAKTALVTGGTEGIGRAVALALAREGDRVIFVGRNADNGARVLRELRAFSHLDHRFVRADLSLLSEAGRVADEVEEVDTVVCCAGILSTIPEWTTEGLERTFVLNYLSRYVLVRRLLPRLGDDARVILVANAGMYPDRIDLDDLAYQRGKPGLEVSARAQAANDLFALELASRTTALVSCVYPGMVRTAVFDNARGLPWFFALVRPLLRFFAISPAAAAETPVFLAHQSNRGGFWGPRCTPRKTPPGSAARRKALWDASEDACRAFLPSRSEVLVDSFTQGWS